MVYIKKWPEYTAACLELYNASPEKTRYLIKVHPARQWLVLKVTDDVTTLKFRTRSSIILNRFETFNKDVIASMAGAELPSVAAAAAAAAAASADGATTTAKDGGAAAGAGGETGGTAAGPGPQAAGAAGGGGGKKKKKKGKK